MHLLLPTQIQPLSNLLLMHLIQILQQHITIPLPTLILTHIIAPTTQSAGETTRYIRFFADIGNGMEVGSYGENDPARTRQASVKSQWFGRNR